jgi:hypothetical protein
MFNMVEQRKRINTGIAIKDPVTRKTDLVFGDFIVHSDDTHIDPATDYIIGKSRYAYIGNVEHTVRYTGTF